ncbi:MAG: hypothetical protein M1819_003588 [Sarea resinae]|nr:MAG: hypothetical protein M1819_003588 [Sarea resinae]
MSASIPSTSADVKGRVAIVTGAGGGLGRAYAILLAARGAKVVVNDYGGSLEGEAGSISMAQTVVDEITSAGGIAVADGHDISVPTSAKAIVDLAVRTYGTVDILINNAAISGKLSPHDDVDVAAFTRVWEIATLGTSMMMSAVYKIMEKNHYGRIINTSSDSIFGFGTGGDGAYPASKGATFALTRDLGQFSERHGIKINGVMPAAASRMTDPSPNIKKVCRQYFPPETAAPFVVALASEGCPVSGEWFTIGANRAARTTLATFPGHSHEEDPEGFLKNFDKVMGEAKDVYFPKNLMDQVRYSLVQAAGVDIGSTDFGLYNAGE